MRVTGSFVPVSFAQDLHPIDFLDEVGEVICDLTGTCVDLFEPWFLTLMRGD